jgi:hypothetical protein
MLDTLALIVVIAFGLFVWDQRQIAQLQRLGKYNESSYESVFTRLVNGLTKLGKSAMTRLSYVLVKLKLRKKLPLAKNATSEPVGEISVVKTTICAGKFGKLQRLTYCVDTHNQPWFIVQDADADNSVLTKSSGTFEPAVIPFEEKVNELI